MSNYKKSLDATKANLIIREINLYYGINCMKNTRLRRIVFPRQVAMYFMSIYTGMSLRCIASYFNRKNNTVYHALETVHNALETSKVYEKDHVILNDMILRKTTDRDIPKNIELEKSKINNYLRTLDLEGLKEVSKTLKIK